MLGQLQLPTAPLRNNSAHMRPHTKVNLQSVQSMTPWAWTVSTFFGVGYLAPGSGTYASLATVALWWGAAQLFLPDRPTLVFGTAVAAIAMTMLGTPAATIVAREANRKDPGFVVIDEVAGQLFALVLTPAFARHAGARILLGFVFFRLFDILKPWPIRRLELLPEGPGIMLDDVAAGAAATLLVATIMYTFHHILQ